MGSNCWIDLIYFEWRLTETSRRNIRTVVIGFPEIERGVKSDLDRASTGGPKSLKTFPALKALTPVVYEDILTSDLQPLRSIPSSVPATCDIVLDVRMSSVYHKDGGLDNRPIRVSSTALDKMKADWKWTNNGNWELVDQRHRLRNEEDWLDSLRRNHRREVRFGYLKEPSLFDEGVLFL
ncbi:MAG: hypothetical protein Q9221_002652 [Calogaya cf. arnoldii]